MPDENELPRQGVNDLTMERVAEGATREAERTAREWLKRVPVWGTSGLV